MPDVVSNKDLREGLPSNDSCGSLRGVRLLPGGSIEVFSPATRSPEWSERQGPYGRILSNNSKCCKDENRQTRVKNFKNW